MKNQTTVQMYLTENFSIKSLLFHFIRNYLYLLFFFDSPLSFYLLSYFCKNETHSETGVVVL